MYEQLYMGCSAVGKTGWGHDDSHKSTIESLNSDSAESPLFLFFSSLVSPAPSSRALEFAKLSRFGLNYLINFV